jgi:hypothetical protein
MTTDRVETGLAKLLLEFWWVLFPPFTILVCRFSFERGCRDPYELLRPIMQHQAGALTVAAVYVGAYAWFLAAVLLNARIRADRSVMGSFRPVGDRHAWKIAAMAAALAIDNLPRALWHLLFTSSNLC